MTATRWTSAPGSAASRGIVTPEAVLLEFDTAGAATRGIARMIDLAVVSGLVLALGMVYGLVSVVSGGAAVFANVFFIVAVFLVVFGYSIGMEVWRNGRSVGKAALGVRVVTVQGAPVRFRHAAIRSALDTLDLIVSFGFVGLVTMLVSRRHQRLGDLFAGTIVIRDRVGASEARAVVFPPIPGLEPYAATLDTTLLDRHQYGVVRSFLLRVTLLDRDARVSLASRLAAAVAAQIGVTVPPDVHPEYFLVSVAVAYQRRHGLIAPPLHPWS